MEEGIADPHPDAKFHRCDLKMWAYNIVKNGNFLYKFAHKGKFWGLTEKVEYRCTTTNLPLCNDTITVLKIALHHRVSVITNVVIPKRDKKHHTFSSTAGARPTIPTIPGVVIKEVRAIFAAPNFFDPISSFAARGKNRYRTNRRTCRSRIFVTCLSRSVMM